MPLGQNVPVPGILYTYFCKYSIQTIINYNNICIAYIECHDNLEKFCMIVFYII